MLPIEVTRHGLSPGQFGPLIAINGILIVLFQPVVAHYTARFRHAHVLAVAAVVLGIGFGATAFVGTWGGFAVSIAVWTLAEMAWMPLGPLIVARMAPDDLRGSYQGAYGLAWALAATIGPAAGGYVLDRFGSETLWLGCLVIGIVAAAGFLRMGEAIGAPRDGTIGD
jgi:MFS family permease